MLSRIYSVDQANKALDELRPRVERVVEVKRRITDLMSEVNQFQARGALRDPEARRLHRQTVSELEKLAVELRDLMHEVETYGVVLKDLDVGLLDFPTIMGGEPAYLCWKLGEGDVAFYYTVGSNYAKKRPIG